MLSITRRVLGTAWLVPNTPPSAIFIKEGKAVREPVKVGGHCSLLLWP